MPLNYSLTVGHSDKLEKPWLYKDVSSSGSGLQGSYLSLMLSFLGSFSPTSRILFPNETLLVVRFISCCTVLK